jgi:hypothetical protein
LYRQYVCKNKYIENVKNVYKVSDNDDSSGDEKSGGEKDKKRQLLRILQSMNATHLSSKLHQAILQPFNNGELILKSK